MSKALKRALMVGCRFWLPEMWMGVGWQLSQNDAASSTQFAAAQRISIGGRHWVEQRGRGCEWPRQWSKRSFTIARPCCTFDFPLPVSNPR